MTRNPESGGQLPNPLPENPLPLAAEWFEHAQQSASQRNPNAMSLATVDKDGTPSARIVLCKAFVAEPGYLVFYTNYESAKSRAILANERVALIMHWDALGQQIRMEGIAVKSPAAESDAYFATRGWGSRLGAWGSDQSKPIATRAQLEKQIRERAVKLGVELGKDINTLAGNTPPDIPRPPHWGGFRVWPEALEIWREGADRIHDRARWVRALTRTSDDTFECSAWKASRLQP
ncbi:MAG: pyridoxamine 5'-phosphate oxidase [Woeseia sp.]|nr:pyridoxamine 5'-phosphate oxidase [Woeseia sp.]MBT8096925.1 pyridoxamine 5'-phosphate oxidase [Woeseia sp.]NNE61599.1 pyridoxamine 5'-phosphate oxidase [Woeseia sp.]NNL55480.1 pyridoxamine 5'-phosphate oxidase [Woeseia sp.]